MRHVVRSQSQHCQHLLKETARRPTARTRVAWLVARLFCAALHCAAFGSLRLRSWRTVQDSACRVCEQFAVPVAALPAVQPFLAQAEHFGSPDARKQHWHALKQTPHSIAFAEWVWIALPQHRTVERRVALWSCGGGNRSGEGRSAQLASARRLPGEPRAGQGDERGPQTGARVQRATPTRTARSPLQACAGGRPAGLGRQLHAGDDLRAGPREARGAASLQADPVLCRSPRHCPEAFGRVAAAWLWLRLPDIIVP